MRKCYQKELVMEERYPQHHEVDLDHPCYILRTSQSIRFEEVLVVRRTVELGKTVALLRTRSRHCEVLLHKARVRNITNALKGKKKTATCGSFQNNFGGSRHNHAKAFLHQVQDELVVVFGQARASTTVFSAVAFLILFVAINREQDFKPIHWPVDAQRDMEQEIVQGGLILVCQKLDRHLWVGFLVDLISDFRVKGGRGAAAVRASILGAFIFRSSRGTLLCSTMHDILPGRPGQQRHPKDGDGTEGCDGDENKESAHDVCLCYETHW